MAWLIVIINTICVLMNLGKICDNKLVANLRIAYVVATVLQLITIHLITSAYL